MKNQDLHFNPTSITAALNRLVRALSAYRSLIFFLIVAILYGFIIWQINAADNAPPSQSEETSQSTPQPHIDPTTVAKMQSLQDNSVNVQTLFNQARQNPFQE